VRPCFNVLIEFALKRQRDQIAQHFATSEGLPPKFDDAIEQLSTHLFNLLLPITQLAPSQPTEQYQSACMNHLRQIVRAAAILSIHMQSQTDTIYRFPDARKDEEFDTTKHHCDNWEQMIRTNPHSREYDPANGVDEEELQRGFSHKALVRIAMFPECVAHFQARYGGEELGIKSKRLTRGCVALRWGRPRALDEGGGVLASVDFEDAVAESLQDGSWYNKVVAAEVVVVGALGFLGAYAGNWGL
jgi:hypothetical protein